MRKLSMPVISTCHIAAATSALLEHQGDQNPWTVVAPYEEGFFIYVQSEDMPEQPQDISDIFAWARSNSFEWVRLDADGDEVDALPQYEW